MSYNLDFSGWKAGNSALANANLNAMTTKAKAKASQTAGLTAGIGTVIGAIFGGPAGAAIGNQIGGSLSGGGNSVSEEDKFLANALTDDWSDPFGRKASKKKNGTPFAGDSNNQGDMMQMASAMNMIDKNGNVIPTFLEVIKNAGASA